MRLRRVLFISLYGCLHVCKMIFDVWQFEVWLLPYIRPLVQVIPAGPDEIRRKSPYLFDVLEGPGDNQALSSVV